MTTKRFRHKNGFGGGLSFVAFKNGGCPTFHYKNGGIVRGNANHIDYNTAMKLVKDGVWEEVSAWTHNLPKAPGYYWAKYRGKKEICFFEDNMEFFWVGHECYEVGDNNPNFWFWPERIEEPE